MALCLPFMTLAFIIGTIYLIQIITYDTWRSRTTFLLGMLALLLQFFICHLGGDIAGWISFVVFVGAALLGIFFYSGMFDEKKPFSCPPIIPKPSGSGSSGGGGGGGGGGRKPWDGTLPMCPDCPPAYILA